MLAEDGREVVRLVPVEGAGHHRPTAQERRPRRLGLAEGMWTIPEDFDAPLPEDLLDLFYNGPIFPDESKARGDEKP